MDTDELDAKVRAYVARGQADRATEKILREYGDELARYLRSQLSAEADAQEAFSRMSEELWKSLSRFDGRCSVRTWCYMLARHAAIYIRTLPRHQREQLVSSIPSVQQAATEMWSNSYVEGVHQREVYVEAKDALEPDDRTLLVLRIDRNLSWREIAVVLLGEDADDDAVTRKAAALRKQFERVKDELAKKLGKA
ncbi:MAG: sigma-70 family RNA polymerase sigma factor [Kofleriaceae bacterium]